MKFEFLGTGTSVGVPMIGCKCEVCNSLQKEDKRLRSSLKIEIDDKTIIIDTTPDFRYQMLRSNTTNIDAILITHHHKDHLAGLDDIRPFNFIYNKSIPLYALPKTISIIKKEFKYAFQEKNAGTSLPKIKLNSINFPEFYLFGKKIIPIVAKHFDIKVVGFRFENFCYITDANFIAKSELNKIKGCDYIVLNALRIEKHPSHFNLDQAIEVAKSLKIPNVYFTHISHQLGLHHKINDRLPSGYNLAFDGLKLFT